jgi:DNA-binding transcriptional LysR family regulator
VGIAAIPELALTQVREEVVIRRLTGQVPYRRIGAAVLSGGYRSPAASAMLEILQEVSEVHVAARRPALTAVG